MLVVVGPKQMIALDDDEKPARGPHPQGSVIDVKADTAKWLAAEGKVLKLGKDADPEKVYLKACREAMRAEFGMSADRMKAVSNEQVRSIYGTVSGAV